MLIFNKPFIQNIGPQHPSVHGVLRIALLQYGEKTIAINIEIGFLHRGTEKVSEFLNIDQCNPLYDRYDYVSSINYEYQSLLFKRNQLTRIKKFYTTNIEHFIIIFLELSRVSNHLLPISTNIMDLGGVTPYLWVFDIRDQIMEVIEFSTGSRLHSQLLTKKQLNNTKINTSSTLKKIKLIVSSITSKISELYELIFLG
ncbi:MAG: hypothetical protein GY679_00045 [Mycoplasma sp.]|nr:hypothetical protein [Mycoplasma sp.]